MDEASFILSNSFQSANQADTEGGHLPEELFHHQCEQSLEFCEKV